MYCQQSGLLSSTWSCRRGGLQGPRPDETSAGQVRWPRGPPDPPFCRVFSPSSGLSLVSDPCHVYQFNETHPTSLGEFFLAGQQGSRGGGGGTPWVWEGAQSLLWH